MKKDEFNGDIRFSNVHFSYPSRSDISILNHLSFDVQCGQTIALVGSSGSGKSTCIQLLQRFYDPQAGSITIDGRSVSEYDLKWLRQRIGVVSQEPILFHTTIRQNILLGCESATDEQIHDAAKMANAHDFIMTLPHVRICTLCKTRINLTFDCRNMRRKLVNVVVLYQVDRNKELLLHEHFLAIQKFYFLMKVNSMNILNISFSHYCDLCSNKCT